MGALAVRDIVTKEKREIPGTAETVMAAPGETAMAVAQGGLYALTGETQGGGQAGGSDEVTNSVISDAVYPDGTYTGTGSTPRGEIQVTITVSDGKVSNVQVDSHSETADIGGNTYEIDAVSGATETAKGFADAVKAALEQAR